MRIGLLTTSFPRGSDDAAGAFVLGFARALAARGHTVDVLCPEPPEPLAGPPAWPGIRVEWVPYMRPRALQSLFYDAGVPDNVARHPSRALLAGPFVASLFLHARRAARDWDAVVSHWAVPSALVAGLVARGRPHLAVLHSADVHLLDRIGGRALARWIDAGASTLVFSARSLRDRFATLLGSPAADTLADRSMISPMGFEPVAGARTRPNARRTLGVEGFVLGFLGRMVPVKGVMDLLAAVAGLEGVTLLLAGSGPEEGRLRDQARAAGVRARWLGWLPARERTEALRAADAIVVPSRILPSGRTEGTPVTAIEAMAEGTPVIATDVGGLGDLVGNGEGGIIVPPGSPELLRDAIVRLRDDPTLRRRLGRGARRRTLGRRWDRVLGTLAPRIGA